MKIYYINNIPELEGLPQGIKRINYRMAYRVIYKRVDCKVAFFSGVFCQNAFLSIFSDAGMSVKMLVFLISWLPVFIVNQFLVYIMRRECQPILTRGQAPDRNNNMEMVILKADADEFQRLRPYRIIAFILMIIIWFVLYIS